MPVSLIYMFVRMLLGALLPGGRDDAAKELEIGVLRHQIGVLRRQVPPSLSSASVVVEEPIADRIDVPVGPRCARPSLIRVLHDQDDLRRTQESRSVGLPVFGPPRPMASGAWIS